MIGSPPLYFEDLKVGYQLEGTTVTVTEAQVVAYAGLVGDFNKLHMNAVAASETQFGRRVAHGPFVLALTIGQLAQRLSHLDVQAAALIRIGEVRFVRPVFLGDTLTPLGRVLEACEQRGDGAVTIEMASRNQHGKDVFMGTFTLLVAKLSAASTTEGAALAERDLSP